MSSSSTSSSVSMKRILVIMLVALVVISTLQVEPVVAKDKSDLLFVKGKFIKKDKKGVIVVDDKCCCKGHGRRK